MSDAPERIWVAPWREGDWSEGDWDDNEGKTLNDKPCIQYVRADRIEALTDKLAKAVEGLEVIRDRQYYRMGPGITAQVIARATIAKIKGETHDGK